MSELRRPSSLPPLWVVLTIPVVTVFCRENGLPMATTNSPGRKSADRPSSSTGSFTCSTKRVWGKNKKKYGWRKEPPQNMELYCCLQKQSNTADNKKLIDSNYLFLLYISCRELQLWSFLGYFVCTFMPDVFILQLCAAWFLKWSTCHKKCKHFKDESLILLHVKWKRWNINCICTCPVLFQMTH